MRIFIVILIFLPGLAFSQTRILKGKITEWGEPLIGANVYIKGTSQGTISSITGEFELAIPANEEVTLIISFFSIKEIKVKPDQNEITIDVSNANYIESGGKITSRLGGIGTGTYDEGLWYFKASQGLGPQVFEFSNSWGVGADFVLNYRRWSTAVHTSITRTRFMLTVDDGNFIYSTEDYTSHNQLILEQTYVGKRTKRFQPFVGANVGVLMTRDIELIMPGAGNVDFVFIDPLIYGLTLGFDYYLNRQGLGLHVVIRGQTFEYTTEDTVFTNRQRLLDQVWWMNYNHIQVGLTRTF